MTRPPVGGIVRHVTLKEWDANRVDWRVGSACSHTTTSLPAPPTATSHRGSVLTVVPSLSLSPLSPPLVSPSPLCACLLSLSSSCSPHSLSSLLSSAPLPRVPLPCRLPRAVPTGLIPSSAAGAWQARWRGGQEEAEGHRGSSPSPSPCGARTSRCPPRARESSHPPSCPSAVSDLRAHTPILRVLPPSSFAPLPRSRSTLSPRLAPLFTRNSAPTS